MNLFSLLNGVLFTVLPVLILVGCRSSWRDALSFVLLALVGALAVVANQGAALRRWSPSSHRPYLTVSDWGLEVDAGFLDRWSFPWSAIDAVAPELPYSEQQLRRNAWVRFTIRRYGRTAALASDIQHGRFPDIFEMGRHFARLSPHETPCFWHISRATCVASSCSS